MHGVNSQGHQMTMVGTIGLGAIPPPWPPFADHFGFFQVVHFIRNSSTQQALLRLGLLQREEWTENDVYWILTCRFTKILGMLQLVILSEDQPSHRQTHLKLTHQY